MRRTVLLQSSRKDSHSGALPRSKLLQDVHDSHGASIALRRSFIALRKPPNVRPERPMLAQIVHRPAQPVHRTARRVQSSHGAPNARTARSLVCATRSSLARKAQKSPTKDPGSRSRKQSGARQYERDSRGRAISSSVASERASRLRDNDQREALLQNRKWTLQLLLPWVPASGAK
jgi:hypothetical protein